MALLEDLNWRHAVKGYDATKKVSIEDLNKILEAARLAPTSSGLQPFRVVVVENQELKEKMVEGALNPEVMRDCSHVLVFAAWDQYSDEKIDKVYDHHTDVRDLPQGRFNSYTDKLKEIYGMQSPNEHFAHTARQTYIALALAMAQAAELKVDCTPAEGFINEKVDEILELGQRGLKSVSLLYLGYRNPETDYLATMKKVRIPMDEFIIRK